MLALCLSPLFERHLNPPGHPERPERLRAVAERLGEAGLLDRCEPIEPTQAARDALLRAHAESLVAAHEAMHARGGGVIDEDTAMSPRSWPVALLAAGTALAAAEAIARGTLGRAFLALRPPGHHATRTRAMGFCLLNNAALAAHHLLALGLARRPVIVDFDVHHGNGTEDVFAGDERVLMASIFQHPLYPYSGVDQPAPNMVNVPLPEGTGSDGFRAAVRDRWLPALEAFRPQVIFVSAGFDAHREDPLAGLAFVDADYGWVTRELVAVAGRHAKGRIVSTLEGGYALSALGRSAAEHVRALVEG